MSLFTLNTYARGESGSYNLMLDFQPDRYALGDLPVALNSPVTYPDEWSVVSTTLGTGAAVAAEIIDTAGVYSGEHSLQMSVSTTGSTTTNIHVMSPHVDVVPGETYLFAARVGKASSGVGRSYFRIAAGADDNMTEYPASSFSNDLDGHYFWDDYDPPNVSSDPSLMYRVSRVVTMPAGVNRAAIRLYNYQPTTGSTLYWDEFEVYKLTGEDAYTGDTGWIDLALINSWVDYATVYGVPAFRKIGNQVRMRGIVKDGTGVGISVIPEGFRPGDYTVFPTMMNGTPSVAHRLNVSGATGDVSVSTGYASWIAITAQWFTE